MIFLQWFNVVGKLKNLLARSWNWTRDPHWASWGICLTVAGIEPRLESNPCLESNLRPCSWVWFQPRSSRFLSSSRIGSIILWLSINIEHSANHKTFSLFRWEINAGHQSIEVQKYKNYLVGDTQTLVSVHSFHVHHSCWFLFSLMSPPTHYFRILNKVPVFQKKDKTKSRYREPYC